MQAPSPTVFQVFPTLPNGQNATKNRCTGQRFGCILLSEGQSVSAEQFCVDSLAAVGFLYCEGVEVGGVE